MAYDVPIVTGASVTRPVRVAPVIALAVWASGALLAQRDQPAAGGAALFQRRCASCHSVEGRAPSLSTGVFTHGGDASAIAQTIRAGVPGTQMPAFPALSTDEIAQLVTYIHGLSANAAGPAAPA